MNTAVATHRPITKRAPHKGTEVKKEAWLLQQAPDHYALQLTAGRNEENIKAFISRHDLSEEAAYFRTLKNGDEWYSLIYGSYSDYDQARQALEALPEQLRNNSPWVRTLSSVQTSIVKFGGNHSE